MELFFALLIKHAIVDLGMQSRLEINKKVYFGNSQQHYVEHGLATIVVCMLFMNPTLALFCGVADYIIHWHVDYGKHQINARFGIKSQTQRWWWSNVLDQSLHYATYYALAKMFM